jgi:glycosyltransferase involved in cell wall biosynthesis
MKNKKIKNSLAISVVMSTYNEPLDWISKSIDSILEQTFKDFEFIIINDNPKRQELKKFLEDYRKKDPRIKLIKNKTNLGLTKSLNRGLRIAQGKYISRMDADDISMKKRFQVQYEYLEKHKKVFLSSTCAINVDENETEISRHFIIPYSKIINWRLKKKNCLYHSTIMFRNEKILYNEKLKFAQDYGLYLFLLKKGKKMIGIPRFLLKYRINSNSITHLKRKEQANFVKLAKKIYLG